MILSCTLFYILYKDFPIKFSQWSYEVGTLVLILQKKKVRLREGNQYLYLSILYIFPQNVIVLNSSLGVKLATSIFPESTQSPRAALLGK